MSGQDFQVVFLDTETTGLDPSKDQIVSFALRTWSLLEGKGPEVAALVLPSVPVPPQVAAINHYDEGAWRQLGAQPFCAVHADMIRELLQDKCIVAGSNPRFDVDFLRWEFWRIGCAFPKISHRMIDTGAMSAPLLVIGHIKGTGLDSLRDYFGINGNGHAHTASGDVLDSIEVFEALLQAFLVKEG